MAAYSAQLKFAPEKMEVSNGNFRRVAYSPFTSWRWVLKRILQKLRSKRDRCGGQGRDCRSGYISKGWSVASRERRRVHCTMW